MYIHECAKHACSEGIPFSSTPNFRKPQYGQCDVDHGCLNVSAGASLKSRHRSYPNLREYYIGILEKKMETNT